MNPFQDPPVQAGPSYGVPVDDAGLPADPPPAYTPSAAQTQSTTLAAGPQRMDFSGPPPLPDRYQAPQLTGNISGQPVEGVGYGYGPRPTHDGPVSPPGQMHPHHSGAHGPPPPLAPVQDNRPTSIPTPGRPLLKDGMLLVYPRGYMCKKCHNTGFKQSDPSHPCKNVRTFALQQATAAKRSTGLEEIWKTVHWPANDLLRLINDIRFGKLSTATPSCASTDATTAPWDHGLSWTDTAWVSWRWRWIPATSAADGIRGCATTSYHAPRLRPACRCRRPKGR